MAHAERRADAAERYFGPHTGQGPALGIIADDLTGAGDTALAAWEPGREVRIVPEWRSSLRASLAGAHAVALNTESRHVLPAEAARRAGLALEALHSLGCRQIYKKVDSTMRGNVGAEVRQLLAQGGFDLAVIAPAFPDAGRITVGGYQLVDGVPVSASPYGADPLSPVRESHLPTLLHEETGWPVGLIALKEVMAGPETIALQLAKLVEARVRLVVVDAARAEDLKALARAIALTPFRVLQVGSAGLAGANRLPLVTGLGRERELTLGPKPPVLVVAGSLNAVTTGQVAHFAQSARLVTVDVPGLLLTESDEQERLVRELRANLLARHDVILTSAPDARTLDRGRELASKLGLGAMQLGAQLPRALGQVVARVLAEQPELSGLVLAGGDTALGVCRALGGGPLQLLDELLPAIPLCRLDAPGGAVKVVTKSGGFGREDALADLAARLKRGEPLEAKESRRLDIK